MNYIWDPSRRDREGNAFRLCSYSRGGLTWKVHTQYTLWSSLLKISLNYFGGSKWGIGWRRLNKRTNRKLQEFVLRFLPPCCYISLIPSSYHCHRTSRIALAIFKLQLYDMYCSTCGLEIKGWITRIFPIAMHRISDRVYMACTHITALFSFLVPAAYILS